MTSEPDRLNLFNVNACIGRGAYEEPVFESAENLIRHLDYLRVGRSLVWHVIARDFNPTHGNRQLLKEIEAGGYRQRLIPAFVITPACYYENGALAYLRDQIGSGRVGALRIIPGVSRFQVRQIERLLRELDEFAPVVFWDSRGAQPAMAFEDLGHVAEACKRTTFVVTQVIWGLLGQMMDLMWRHPNICVDTSWLHVRQSIELLTENFSAQRLMFGLGHKSHYGAAIAALAHAEISDEDRRLIAGGNIQNLLGLPMAVPSLGNPPPILDKKPIWNAFRRGKPVAGVRLIDAHGHNGPHTRGWYLRQIEFDDNLAALRRHVERMGIERLIVSSEHALFGNCLEGNIATAELMRDQHDRFSGYLVFNPRYSDGMIPRLDAFFADPFFVGFKVLPSYWKIPVTDPGYRPVWDYANRHHLPILLHTWNDSWDNPSMLDEIVAEFPNAIYLLGHSGGHGARPEAEALALKYPSVFLEFCGSFGSTRNFEDSMATVGFDRVVFGSDTGAHDVAWELGRFLSMPVADEKLRPALGETMLSILDRRV